MLTQLCAGNSVAAATFVAVGAFDPGEPVALGCDCGCEIVAHPIGKGRCQRRAQGRWRRQHNLRAVRQHNGVYLQRRGNAETAARSDDRSKTLANDMAALQDFCAERVIVFVRRLQGGRVRYWFRCGCREVGRPDRRERNGFLYRFIKWRLRHACVCSRLCSDDRRRQIVRSDGGSGARDCAVTAEELPKAATVTQTMANIRKDT